MIKEDQKPEIDIEINEKDFTMVFWQLLMKGLPKMKDYEYPVFVLTTTNEIASFQIKSKNEKLIFVFPQNYAHRFWDNIFQNLFYSIGRNLIIFERILKVVEKFKLTINSIYHIFLVFEFTKDSRKYLIKITHLNYFKTNLDSTRTSNLESTRFLFITKATNSKMPNDLLVARYFEQALEISIETLNRYHSNQISIEEVLNVDKFFDDLDKYLPFAALILEISNKESPFECFLDYGGTILMTPYSKTEFSLSFPNIKLLLEFRNIIVQDKKKVAVLGNFKNDSKFCFDFMRILAQAPKLNNQNLEFGDNLIIFEYDTFEKLQENMIFVLKFVKSKIFFIYLKVRIEILKKEDFRVTDEFDGKRIRIKVDKFDVLISFSEKPELSNFIEKIENLPEIYESYLNSVSRLNFEAADSNYRKESEQHFSKVLELLYLKSRYEDKKRNIYKTICKFEEIVGNHHKICMQRQALDAIKLEFEIEINEQNDEIKTFKILFIKKMKRNDIKEISLKVKNGTISLISADNTRPHVRETVLTEDDLLKQEINEIYEKFFEDRATKN